MVLFWASPNARSWTETVGSDGRSIRSYDSTRRRWSGHDLSVRSGAQRLLDHPPSSADDIALARSTVSQVAEAMGGLAVQGKHEVLVRVG